MFGVRSTDKDGNTYVMGLGDEKENDVDTKVTVENKSFAAKQTKAKKGKKTPADVVDQLRKVVLDIAPVAAPSELMMVPVELIDTETQVRTEFNDESLRELACDIAMRGVLQPVLLRPGQGGRFTLIAGERRLKACSLAQLKTIPAIIGEVENKAILGMQLAENVQREDLSLKDSAAAVVSIYGECGSVAETGFLIGRSKAWVSKRLAFANGLEFYAAKLLEDGITEDIEILNAVSEIERIAPSGTNTAWSICEKLRSGKCGRSGVRELLAKIKDDVDPVKRAERRKKDDEERIAEAAALASKTKEYRDIQNKAIEVEECEMLRTNMSKLLYKMEKDFISVDGKRLEDWLCELDVEVLERLEHHLSNWLSAGIGASTINMVRIYANNDMPVSEVTAYVMGMKGSVFNFRLVLKTCEEALKNLDT